MPSFSVRVFAGVQFVDCALAAAAYVRCAAGGQEEETASGAQRQGCALRRREASWRLECDLVPVCQELGRGEQAEVRAWYQPHVSDSESHLSDRGDLELGLQAYAVASLHDPVDAGDGVAAWSEVRQVAALPVYVPRRS